MAQVPVNDFGYVFRFDPAVPDTFRIDHQHGALLAQSHASAGSQLHIFTQAASPDLAIEAVEQSGRAGGVAGSDSFRLLLRADKKVNAKWLHSCDQSQIIL
jgi:hypothetical protein